ncbi:MAG: protein kinase [Polyangiaceae bacterium]|nr:protein kinase [Polyangiaceae bacterium]
MTEPPRQSPLELSGFELIRRLGSGGMAEVFLAKKRGAEGTFKLLVVKRILPEHTGSRRFRHMFVEEAQLATRLNHPNIVQVYEFSHHGDELLLSMEYVEGVDLGKLIRAARKRERTLPPWVSAFVVSEVAKGLHYAHERKDEGGLPLAIVHRDVSPQNILISYGGVVKIADFGIASANLFREETGILRGKVAYMSPEQARGERVDRRSDVYALGVVLYEMLTLRSPYGALKDAALAEAVRHGAVRPPSSAVDGVPPELERIVMQALARAPDDRFRTARELSFAVGRALLENQKLVDQTSIEAMIHELLGRDGGTIGDEEEPRTLAAVRKPRTQAADLSQLGTAEQQPSRRVVREVRHVAVVTLRLEGFEELSEALGDAAATRVLASTRATFEAIAYKRGAVWSWRTGREALPLPPPGSGPGERAAVALAAGVPVRLEVSEAAASRVALSPAVPLAAASQVQGAEALPRDGDPFGIAVVGLLQNPARAAREAAFIAIDIHEALAGASQDLPVQIRGSVAVVRGMASGERDELGNLEHHDLHEPAGYLAAELGSRTPFGKTWVAGGVYRLVRREFRWSDGPSIELAEAERHNVPERMRAYVLHRPITADERMAELALAPSDLVGRDAEKADLHAAYHHAVQPSRHSVPPPARRDPKASLRPDRRESAAPGPVAVDAPALPPLPSRRPEAPLGLRSVAPLPGGRGGELAARVVVGEMGIGKTALVEAFVAELPEECRTLRVECSPVKIDLPYAAVSDLLREVTGSGIDDSHETVVARVREILQVEADSGKVDRLVARVAELVTGRQRVEQEEDAASYRHELVVRGVRLLIGAVARERPVVIVIDGLQWADRPSLELLQQVLSRREALPVLILLLTRPDEQANPFLEDLVRIELGGLGADDQIRLVQARLGVREGVAAVCRELVPRVGGNPYFLLEMVDAMLERGALEIVERPAAPAPGGRAPDAAGAHASAAPAEAVLVRHEERAGDGADALPSTIEQLVGDRLRELPPAEHDVVDWLAVAGGPLAEPDLITLARLVDDEAIARLCARGMCDKKVRAVDFRHPLARDVAYHALDAVHRTRMHRRLGEHLATTPLARGLSAAIVAQHLERGEMPGPAAELYIEAATAARSANQTQLALRYFQRALALLPSGDTRRLVAHEALEGIYRQAGQRPERIQHLAALRKLARETRQAAWIAEALVRTARFDLDEGAMARGLPVAQRAAELARLAKRPDVEVDALINLCELLRDLGDANGALEACERALRVASTAGAVSLLSRAEVLRTKGVLLRRAGRLHAACEAHAEAIAMLHELGARRSEARARNALGFALFTLGRFEDTISMCLASIALDVMIGGRFQVAKTLSNVGQSYARLGDVDHGLAYLARAREAHDRYDDLDGRVDTLLVTAGVLLERGDLEAARTLFGDASALTAVGGSVYDTCHALILRALIARADGDDEAAAAYAAEARPLAEGQALGSYHVYATAIEAVARVALGNQSAGLLLATTAFGAVEAMEGSEYGLEVRSLCCEAMCASSLGAAEGEDEPPAMIKDVCQRALGHVDRLASYIRDRAHRALYFKRPPVRAVLERARAHGTQSGGPRASNPG